MTTNYVDVEELRTRVFFETATLDPRFRFEEITPADPAVAEVMNGRWMDGQRRFRLIDCVHPETMRDGVLCTHCGHSDEPVPKKRAAK